LKPWGGQETGVQKFGGKESNNPGGIKVGGILSGVLEDDRGGFGGRQENSIKETLEESGV